MALILLVALLTVPEVALAAIETTFGEPLDTVQDIVDGIRNRLAVTLAVGPVLLGSGLRDRLAAQPVRFFNAGDGKWQYANVGGVGHLAKSFIVLFSFVGIAEALAEPGKTVHFQHVMVIRKLPARSRSSCRKGRNSTAGHCWPFVTLPPKFGDSPTVGVW